jgi:RNA polymerase sigma-54 factor
LQIPTAALDQRIKEELETNPALEEGSDDLDYNQEENLPKSDDMESNQEEQDYSQDSDESYELDDYLSSYMEDDPSSYYNSAGNNYEEDERQGIPIAVHNSFHENLIRQLGLLKLNDETDILIAQQIIGSIDDDGYLRRDPLSIIDDIMFSTGEIVEEEDINRILLEVQKLEPVGVGARDLKECLQLQLKAKIDQRKKEGRSLSNHLLRAYLIIQDHFEEFSKKHYHKLTKYFEIDDQELKEAIDEILKLNPKPASGYSGDKEETNNYIVPDFIITNRDGELELTLNSRNAPICASATIIRKCLGLTVSRGQMVKEPISRKKMPFYLSDKK